MFFDYECKKCAKRQTLAFRIGMAPKTVKCPECNGTCSRVYEEMSFMFKGGWCPPSKKFKFNREMTEMNQRAGERMRKNNRPGLRPAALDYGNGDVREVNGKF